MKSEMKTGLVLGIAIIAGVGILGGVFTTLDQQVQPATTTTTTADGQTIMEIDKSGFKQAPDLIGIADYLNTAPDELKEEIEGKVVLYDIWTYSCINCVRTLPFITAWDEKYADQGLLIIGIHSPEFEFEKDLENVKLAVSKHGIKYPVVLDNEHETWDAFENRYWPRKYIADHEGYIRYDHIGEGGYQETEKVIQNLLHERNSALGLDMPSSSDNLVNISEFEHTSSRTPELYFGYDFAAGRNQLGNSEGFSPGNDVTYQFPTDSIRKHHFYLEGTWTNMEGSMRLVSDTGSILLPYAGKEVNIVTENEADLEIFIDGKIIDPSIAGDSVGTKGRLHTHHPGLYNIVASENYEEHVLQIAVNSPGFEIYTFTFG